jgi:GDP-L-fucose synthase
MDKNSKIYVAGHGGMVGSAIVRKLRKEGYDNLILMTHSELDLTKQDEVKNFFNSYKPEYVFLAAAKVGGIVANNTYPAEFIYNNLNIQTNIIHNSYFNNVKKLLFLGSSCIYPRECSQPIKEEYFMTGSLEKTNDAYAIAKIAGIKMCQSYNKQYGTNYISIMPTNLYGKNDNYHLENSHVFPAMIRKFHEAKIRNDKEIILWGTGSPYREFLDVDDCADACVFLMKNYNNSDIINIGTGKDLTIRNLALSIKKIIGFEGDIIFDSSKPDGTSKKLLDVSKIHSLGWSHSIELEDGIKKTYEDFLEKYSSIS